MATKADPPERSAEEASGASTRPPPLARYWWLTLLRGLVALALALAVTIGGRSPAHLVNFLALYWLTGGIITFRFALAIRPRRGFRLGLVAGAAAMVAAVLVLIDNQVASLTDPGLLVALLGVLAILTGVLRVLGGFAADERLGRRWTLGGIVLGTVEVVFGVLLLVLTRDEAVSEVLVSIVVAWGLVSGVLLLAQGVRLRRVARNWDPTSAS